jgi:hypothetical protein
MNGPEYNNRFGAGASASFINPVVLVLMLLAIVLMLLLPRKWVVVPFLLTIFLTPFGQQVYIGGVHFFIPRILILFGWIRIAWTKMSGQSEVASGGFTSIDKVFILWAIFRATATYLEFLEVGALVNQIAFLWDTLGGFFLLRFLIRDEEDIARVAKTFGFIVGILALTMLNEKFHAQNVFGYIGGRLSPFIRDGAIRSQGPFAGPIPAGTFAATIMSLFIWLWKSGKAKVAGSIAIVAATVMVVTSASSTPLLAYMAVILGILMWPLRGKMRKVRYGIVFAIIGLQLVMKAPFWFLINHIDFVSGNSGYHRAMLVDMCVRHFWDWWLIGVKSTQDWGWDMWDQANQFVSEAESGGLATLICFILLVSRNFGRIGNARKLVEDEPKKQWLFWLLGVALFSHVVSFFGISFNDQSEYGWYALLAIIAAATAPILHQAHSKTFSEVNIAMAGPARFANAFSRVAKPKLPPKVFSVKKTFGAH